jgi:SAM-dependent methyltransferase
MDTFQAMIELHLPNRHLGPGGAEQTRRALDLAGLRGRSGLRVLDLGCGTGASALVLAEELDGHVTAVDQVPAFLEELGRRARAGGVQARVTTRALSFHDLRFEPASFDAVWSEGAIYNLGFEAGVRAWRRYLRPGGVLAVSELTWLTAERPAELQEHWNREYPEVGTASAKLAVLENLGFTPIGYFPLPESCWLDNYYRPLQARFPSFLLEQSNAEAARALVAAEEHEIALYERNRAYVSYGFYLGRWA